MQADKAMRTKQNSLSKAKQRTVNAGMVGTVQRGIKLVAYTCEASPSRVVRATNWKNAAAAGLRCTIKYTMTLHTTRGARSARVSARHHPGLMARRLDGSLFRPAAHPKRRPCPTRSGISQMKRAR